jgi:hypothetical protein
MGCGDVNRVSAAKAKVRSQFGCCFAELRVLCNQAQAGERGQPAESPLSVGWTASQASDGARDLDEKQHGFDKNPATVGVGF